MQIDQQRNPFQENATAIGAIILYIKESPETTCEFEFNSESTSDLLQSGIARRAYCQWLSQRISEPLSTHQREGEKPLRSGLDQERER